MTTLFDAMYDYDGTWRDIETGVDPAQDPYEADGANDGPGIPGEPVYTRLEGPWGVPWWDALEEPNAAHGLPQSPDPLPWSPNEDVGGHAAPGAFEGAFRTSGAVQPWGFEASGGLWGDQWQGRLMRFPANIPERFDPYGVWNTDIRDDLAATLMTDAIPYKSDTTVTTDLLQWPNVWGRW